MSQRVDRPVRRRGRRVRCPLAELLTERELEVLAAYVRTESYVAAAEELGLAEGSVKNHLANARTKVGVSTTTKLVWIAARRLPSP